LGVQAGYDGAMSASIQPRSGGRHQLRVIHRLLPKPFFWTFTGPDSQQQAEAYRDQLTSLLGRGIVPQEMLAPPEKGSDPLLVEVIGQYEQHSTVTESDLALLKLVRAEVAGLRLGGLTYQWTEAWVKRLKTADNLAPGTIRKRVGVLGRAVDWHLKTVTPKGQAMPSNPLRLLPVGYSQYTAAEVAALEAKGGHEKVDVERDRRLAPDEEARCRLALAGVKRVDRERALQTDPVFSLFFDLILDTGIRLSEAFKLRVEHIDLQRGVLRLEGSKATRGRRKPRVVPLKKHLRDPLRHRCEGRKGLVFPFWDGDEAERKVSNRLSARFIGLFRYAAVEDFTEHDLRHEATCRWFELRQPKGGWVFSEIEICRMMGWTSTKMALRYASLRGEDLADRLL
jgi:hypothetical protein